MKKIKEKTKKYEKGSVIIEAVFLIPLILIAIISMLYLSFFVYNRAVTKAVLSEKLVLCNYGLDLNSSKLKNEIEEELTNKLVFMDNYELNTKVGKLSANVEFSGSMKIPFRKIQGLQMEFLKYKCQRKIVILRPVKFIWAIS
ncbi:hypothetical protein SAMN05216249_10943 [Acetitomaculum ruminis DSM 5522]|uniref:TadE-like protein n=1 Tax=Acetitomaculum ruminis DSM 5522 TaxID=1120918 RepID=A0A1I0Y9J8_9FIRM|nr:hypothetical protein [Acetitomaculum ruminis]SFB09882.1 hypothetical protein SAMN05216249_10943 [Acetitomaculum ruminis DSM 5522]